MRSLKKRKRQLSTLSNVIYRGQRIKIYTKYLHLINKFIGNIEVSNFGWIQVARNYITGIKK